MPKVDDKKGIQANAPFQYYCVECGYKIDGEPYEMSLAAYEDSCDPVYFCSKECWDGSEEFNTENWPTSSGG
jgi:hypothetical protein